MQVLRTTLYDTISVLSIVTECQKQFGEKYPHMQLKDWLLITRAYAKERTHFTVIRDDESIQWKMVG